ncbi:hypothetical protein [Spirosoma fluviale]|uniref:Uncharacterized protein n=1 Tax=Spirosoma fluviale TaxID=1597977 RepID=A0A286FDM3_9BACT|nr:hypothetical protein [Spirosoma fluviale]SOD81089.1 hypothetical protein SAMN06269250_1670 [Spirosoma fluviale]
MANDKAKIQSKGKQKSTSLYAIPKALRTAAPKKEKEQKPDGEICRIDRWPVEIIEGYHPIQGHYHQLIRFDNGLIRIKRSPLVCINPATGEEQVTIFETLYESAENHQWLWYHISKKPITKN